MLMLVVGLLLAAPHQRCVVSGQAVVIRTERDPPPDFLGSSFECTTVLARDEELFRVRLSTVRVEFVVAENAIIQISDPTRRWPLVELTRRWVERFSISPSRTRFAAISGRQLWLFDFESLK